MWLIRILCLLINKFSYFLCSHVCQDLCPFSLSGYRYFTQYLFHLLYIAYLEIRTTSTYVCLPQSPSTFKLSALFCLCGWSLAQSVSKSIYASVLVNSNVLAKSGQSVDVDYNYKLWNAFSMMTARDAESLLLWSTDRNGASVFYPIDF